MIGDPVNVLKKRKRSINSIRSINQVSIDPDLEIGKINLTIVHEKNIIKGINSNQGTKEDHGLKIELNKKSKRPYLILKLKM